MSAQLVGQLQADLQIVSATSFYRLTEAEFGMPGLVAIESVGAHVELAQVGPFITIHDSFLDPGLGIGHHPHRANERLFYIVEGAIHHDDALNDIQGVMHEGDLARLTEGDIGMLHREWNGRDDLRTHAFILVYPADPPVERASFSALRRADIVRTEERPGVETLQLIGGRSSFRARNVAIHGFFDSLFDERATLDFGISPSMGMILYPLGGALSVDSGDGVPRLLRGSSQMHPEGPDELAIVLSGEQPRSLRVEAAEGPARLLRITFERTGDDLVVHQPWRRTQ